MFGLTKSGSVLVAALAVTGCIAAGPSFVYSDGQTVVNALSGNSVVGSLSDGVAYCEYHDPNSSVIGRDFEIYAGNWGVYGDDVCYSYPGYVDDCQRAHVQGSRVTFMDQYTGAMVARGNIVPGNVCS